MTMTSIRVSLPRFKPMHGWANRLLRVDLSNGRITAQPIAPYVPDYIGGRGIAARIAWEEYPDPVDPFAPENPLMIFPGALGGSRSPYSGRTELCAFSPQAWPYHWFTRSNIGGHFGGELKRAGYDGIVVTGASDTPMRLVIRDDEIELLPAGDLWGKDTFETLEALEAAVAKGARSFVIGPAGENLSRIATVHTATSSACGHGGFGAVMGAKKLKAITVVGSGRVELADPERITAISRDIARDLTTLEGRGPDIEAINRQLAEAGGGRARRYACTEACLSPCGVFYEDVPGLATGRRHSGHWFCVAPLMAGWGDDGPISRQGVFDWRLGLRGGFEANVISNRYGLNQWELVIGMVPWLASCQNAGLIDTLNGVPMDWRSPDFWARFLHDLTYRQGMGDALAEGGWRAAEILDLGRDIIGRYYTGWGFPGHWDGHGDFANYIVYPFWLVAALQWLTDTRDPIPSGHGYVARVMRMGPFQRTLTPDKEPAMTWEEMRRAGEIVYGDSDAMDPAAEYRGKAYPAFFHTKRSIMKDCLPVDDFVFPLLYGARSTENRIYRAAGVEGPSIEYNLFQAGTGAECSEDEFERSCERIYTLERALHVRHFGRNRAMDELVLPAFEYPENWPSPLTGQRHALERDRFEPLMLEYYRLQGWDPESGWPTRERLAALGLGAETHEEMVAGAERAAARQEQGEQPAPPEPTPVHEIHPALMR
jgi:aldehyde:ferredoxin oxidoreductase